MIENSNSRSNAENFVARKIMKDSRTLAERYPDWPSIQLNLYFSKHGTAEDMAGMSEHLEHADIYFYEDTGGNKKTGMLQKLADADPDELRSDYLDQVIKNSKINGASLKGTSNESIFRSLYGSKKIVGHIDLRPDEQAVDQALKKEFNHNKNKDFLDPNFDKTLSNLKESLENDARIQDQREKIIADRFEGELTEILDAHPELKNKPTLKILMTMGSTHTPLYYKFRAGGVDAKRTFPHKPFIYGLEEQASREFAFGKEPGRDTLARAYMGLIVENMLIDSMKDKINNSSQRDLFVREVVSHFATSEIESVHEQLMNGLTIRALDKVLLAKNLNPLPRNNEQLTDYLEKQKGEKEQRSSEKKRRFWQRRPFQG